MFAPSVLPPRHRRADEWLSLVAEGLAGALLHALVVPLYPVLGRRWDRWGATDEELRRPLPADGALPEAVHVTTRALTIHTSPAQIWPWLLQIGQGRGGFYSYELLENLVGCRMRNLTEIVPTLQILEEGDPIYFHPLAPPMPITLLDPDRALVIGDWWTFALEPLGASTICFIVRTRIPLAKRPLGRLAQRLLLRPSHFVMERKMMLELRRLAERGR